MRMSCRSRIGKSMPPPCSLRRALFVTRIDSRDMVLMFTTLSLITGPAHVHAFLFRQAVGFDLLRI